MNRLAIGIQSFIDRDFAVDAPAFPDAASAVWAVGEAQRAGFENLTLDLFTSRSRR